MDKTFEIIFFIWISTAGVFCQYFSPNSPLSKDSIVSASYDTYKSTIEPLCVTHTSGQQNRIFPTGQSMENLIALIERLEIMLENDTDSNLKQHIGADNVAKLLLRRFRFDGYDRAASSMPYQKSRDTLLSEIANAFFTQTGGPNIDNNYYFPDKFYNQAELCSLYYMLSHNVYNTSDSNRVEYSTVFRGKRQAYNNRQQTQHPQQNYGNYGKQSHNQNQFNRQFAPIDSNPNNNNNNAVQSEYLAKYPIKEEGVVSFRGNMDEAIAPARVLIGVIAGLTTDLKTQSQQVLKELSPRKTLREDKVIDPVMAVTIADLLGFATGQQGDDTKFYFGIKGRWSSGSCTTHYALTDITLANFKTAMDYMKATKAELRGGIDGYLIGKNLKSMAIGDIKRLRLSTILRSFYSKPKTYKSSTFTISYCNRDQQINSQDLQNTASTYMDIMAKHKSGSDGPNTLLSSEFNSAFSLAQQKETNNGYNDYCSAIPSGTLDKSAPCETPSDVIYIVDATSTQKIIDSANIVSLINGNLNNIRADGGAVTIFANSQGQNSINSDINNQIPRGTEQWPLIPMAFNSTNTGYAQCRINDYNTTTLTPVPNTGKYLKYLNQTLFFYEWWNPRTNDSAVPAKTAVLIDYDSVVVAPESGQDRNDYNYYKDQLRYRHRDVRFLSVTNKLDLFKDIIRTTDGQDSDAVSTTNFQQLGSNLAKKICENPATFQYNRCNDRKSDNVRYEGFVTPGYKQNWAMYPEFFLKSFDIRFTFKAEEGDIKVCYDRWFPPERQDYCKELKSGEEGVFEISNPCKGKSFSSCEPFYFTVWGKDRTSSNQCLDDRCLSLDQVKFVVTHSGVQCSSSNHLLPSTAFQLISLSIFAILYLFLNK